MPLALALVLGSLSGCGKEREKNGIAVLDAGGDTLAVLQSADDLSKSSFSAYLEIALLETAEILSRQENTTVQEALDSLFDRQLRVETAFDRNVYEAVTGTQAVTQSDLEMGIAIVDQLGNLLAAYSSDPVINFAIQKNAPYSAFKPLSVYLPAIASGQVTWFTRYEDSPYKQLPGEDGALQDWPRNSDDTYSMAQVPVYAALKDSLNTVAVKCLSQMGVMNSITFLQDNLGIPLKQEEQAAKALGEEEVIGNVALGYLESGVSPVDMAGYYQIFGTGGRYTKPCAVTRLEEDSGAVLYERKIEYKEVTTPEAADVMNRLLQEVVVSGTGTGARLEETQVAGKTGTGDDHGGNWFVGLIPGYSCAVWHGKAEGNQAANIFGAVMKQVFAGSEKKRSEFSAFSTLHWEICCAESGMPIGDGCSIIKEAYFITDYVGQPCNIHNKK